MQYPVSVTELQSFERHGHPRLDVGSLKYQGSILDDSF